MISAIFTEMTTIATAFVSFLTSLFTSVVGVIWTPGVGENPGSLTVLGTLFLVSIVTGLVIWALYFIRNLIRVRHKA